MNILKWLKSKLNQKPKYVPKHIYLEFRHNEHIKGCLLRRDLNTSAQMVSSELYEKWINGRLTKVELTGLIEKAIDYVHEIKMSRHEFHYDQPELKKLIQMDEIRIILLKNYKYLINRTIEC